ncbi:MAG: spore coat U domain-containing protein [Acidobacteriota bacterium]
MSKHKSSEGWVLALAALTVWVSPSVAATPTTTFGVSATVQASCDVSATAMSFGAYTAAAVNATSAISVTCTNSTPYNIGLSAGTSTGATTNARSMSGPSATPLRYALTSDPNHAVNWGATVGSDTVAGSGTGSVQQLIIYGQAPASQYVAPGRYADTITVTVTY